MTCETVRVAGTLDGVREAVEAFDRFGEAQGLPADARWPFHVALDEILSNVVRHGLPETAGLGAETIVLTFSVDGDEMSVEVDDPGAPFDPLSRDAPDTSAPLEERRPGGLGIALVGSLMDSVQYERKAGRNHLRLTRRLPGGLAGTNAAKDAR